MSRTDPQQLIEEQYDRAQELGAAATDLAGLSALLRFVSRVPKGSRRWAQLFAAKGLLHARAFPDVAEALALESVEHAPSYSGFNLLAKIAQHRGDHRARRRYQSLAAEQADAPTVRSTFIERWAVAETKRRLRPGDTAAKRDARRHAFFRRLGSLPNEKSSSVRSSKPKPRRRPARK
ncbi:MAG: hypothetical protein ABTQ32_30115 [Myxococcaceae bacterium]